jgi:hypothetical protein
MKTTKLIKMLNILSDGRRHQTSALVKSVGHRFSVQIFELRELGYLIRTTQDKNGTFWFQMRGAVKVAA